jgi:hypothetical protein
MNWKQEGVAILAMACGLTVAACGAQPQQQEAEADGIQSMSSAITSTPTGRLMVWSAPTQQGCMGQSPCTKDMRNWMQWACSQPAYVPDIVATTEVTGDNNTYHDTLALWLSASCGHNYGSVGGSFSGGAAIIYRTDRLQYISHQVNCMYDANTQIASPCAVHKTLSARFRDKADNRYVNFSAVHLPNVSVGDGQYGQPSYWNVKRADDLTTGLGGAALHVVAGDFNVSDKDYATNQLKPWYWDQLMSWGWFDATRQACFLYYGSGGVESCISNNNWTHGGAPKRIDFIFSKGNVSSNYPWHTTLPFEWAKAVSFMDYSDHKAIGTVLVF